MFPSPRRRPIILRARLASTWAMVMALLLLTALGGCGDGGGARNDGDPVNNELDAGSPDSASPDADEGSDAQGDPPDAEAPDADEPDAQEPDAPVCEPLDCADFLGCQGADCPTLSDYAQVVPGPGLPAEVSPQNANNNLDVVEHEGRVFLAFRTAPFHFADDTVELYVVSSEDQETWRFEGRFFMETDLREMRFLSWRGRLWMYFAVLGTNPLDFEPQGMMVTEYQGPDQWTEPQPFYGEGFIPWRTKVIDDVPYMITYVGGENIYDIDGEPIEIHWLTTEDGVEWTPVVPEQPVVLSGGSSETAFVRLDDGAVVAVSRNEAGDALGWGSKICRAEPEALGDWRCVGDLRKYDSPLMFRHGQGIYLVGRRHVTETGHYDLGEGDTPAERTRRNLVAYSSTPKRCALWQVDPDALEVSFIMDLPSRGDTCFPGLLDHGQGRFTLYNYTSPIESPEMSWLAGQGGPTLIYRVSLSFPEAP